MQVLNCLQKQLQGILPLISQTINTTQTTANRVYTFVLDTLKPQMARANEIAQSKLQKAYSFIKTTDSKYPQAKRLAALFIGFLRPIGAINLLVCRRLPYCGRLEESFLNSPSPLARLIRAGLFYHLAGAEGLNRHSFKNTFHQISASPLPVLTTLFLASASIRIDFIIILLSRYPYRFEAVQSGPH